MRSGDPASASPVVAFWDTETNGLLDTLTIIHSVGAEIGGRFLDCADQPGYQSIASGLGEIEQADIRVAHNAIDFDERATRKIYPSFIPKDGSKVIDTLILARLLFAKVEKTGPNNHKCPPQLRSRHSLKAWGYRLGEHKAEYEGGWEKWSPEMQSYMGQDIKTLKRLFTYLMSRKPSFQALEIEQDFAAIMARQERWGFAFNVEAGRKLAAELQRMEGIMEVKLVDHFGEWWAQSPQVRIPKSRKVKMIGFPDVTIRRYGTKGNPLRPYIGPPLIDYERGAEFTPVERKIFNPKSRDDVKFKLHQLYGWKPTKFNKPKKDKKTGKLKAPTPVIDDEVLRQLPYPEAQILADYFVVVKTLGALSAGKKSWLGLVKEDGRIHGRVIHIGTYTHRAAHMDPNMGQIKAVEFTEDKKPIYGLEGGFGAECRSLFGASPGFVLVGTDASGIQLRLFGHYLAKYDGGEYARIVDKEDPHAWLRDVVGTDIVGAGAIGRAIGKTLGYARLLGGGDLRLGQIAAPLEKAAEQKKVGKEIKERLKERFKAEILLKDAVTNAVQERGYIISLDGRRVDVLKAHTGLATLLQAGEKAIMAKAIAILDAELKSLGWRCGVDEAGNLVAIADVAYEFCANIHDEFQTDVRERLAEIYMEIANRSIVTAGEMLNLKCPLKGESRKGSNWLETH